MGARDGATRFGQRGAGPRGRAHGPHREMQQLESFWKHVQDIELRAAWRCWLLACVLARVVLDEATPEEAAALARSRMASGLTILSDLDGRDLYSIGDAGGRVTGIALLALVWGGVASAASRADPRGVRDYFCSMILNACRRKLLFVSQAFPG